MKKAIEFINSTINNTCWNKMIRVYGWQKEYDYLLKSSVSKYLFEDLNVIENLAPLTNENREGIKKPKYYITVHDTGDADETHNALFWSTAVKEEKWEQGKYACSYQYVVGNDGVYHNIPDDELAWHAGDSTKFDYKLYDSNVTGINEYPIITIDEEGYYCIDGKKSSILAPTIHKKIDDEIVIDRIAKTSDINDQGVLCKLINGKYYIGENYYNSGYELIANRGGNNNSIGIESCINENSDIYYTWQLTAKLVANLLHNNSLSFDDIKQHHYFSGKNCPQTMRMNDMWEHFMQLVKIEYQAINFKKQGFSFELVPISNNIINNGRIINNEENNIFNIKITNKNNNEQIVLNYNIKKA